MTRNRKNSGFTLAEVLIVVAITVILMGVAFVGVQSYQRSSTRLEFDGIAKEIFIAAQNHLTAAESQGYLKIENNQFGHLGTLSDSDKEDIYYILASDTESEIKNLMLPNYALDSMAMGGSYIIRYQPSSATVLDVFYSRPGRSSLLTVTGKTLTGADYPTLMSDTVNYRRGGERNRQNYNEENVVVGWYGGVDAIPKGIRLQAPSFEVINAEKLHVKVTDPNYSTGSDALSGYTVKLILVGKISKAEKYYTLRDKDGMTPVDARVSGKDGSYDVILDDITNEKMHFGDITADYKPTTVDFIPGEDVTIKLVAYSTEDLSNIAMSAEKTTNSLFADPVPYKITDMAVRGTDIGNKLAGISNIRHLQNLDAAVSNLGKNGSGDSFTLQKAAQTENLDWESFQTATGKTRVYSFANSQSEDKCCFPVTPHYAGEPAGLALAYDGQGHEISKVKVDCSGSAGLFGTLAAGSSVSNLRLIDFDIKTSSGNAGALVGTANGTTITNVLAHNSAAGYTANVTASSGDAGGLIGSAANCIVNKSAAALTVTGSGSAGGLIGSASATSVSASYSGGHTYSDNPDYTGMTQPSPARNPYPVRYYNDKNEPIYNVTGGTTAGGLIGSMTGGSAEYCYSTCSATGATAGGFVGTATGSISNSYCTGLVHGAGTESITTTDGKTKNIPTDGAFAYSIGTVSDCQYFEIINERWDTDNSGKKVPGYYYLTALGKNEGGSITKLDQSWSTYQAFSGDPTSTTAWKDAHPYDSGLTRNYQNKYNLKTVAQLGAEVDAKSDFVAAHYGDWPAPEEFIFN